MQLGLGFTLNGVGGLLGINRTVAVDPLRAGLKSGALGAVLFPSDPVGHAQQLVATLAAVFPPAAGRHVFGPMARIGWGSPTLITIDLGARRSSCRRRCGWSSSAGCARSCPTSADAVVRLQMDVLGVIDFDRREAAVDATLVDSRLAGVHRSPATWRCGSAGAPTRRSCSRSAGSTRASCRRRASRARARRGRAGHRRQPAAAARGLPRADLQHRAVRRARSTCRRARRQLQRRPASCPSTRWCSISRSPSWSTSPATLAVTAGGHTLLSVTLNADAQRARAVARARASASFSILFFDVSVVFDVTIGDAGRPRCPQPVDVAPALLAALARPARLERAAAGGPARRSSRCASWRRRRACSRTRSARSRSASALVPLDRTLDRFGADVPSGRAPLPDRRGDARRRRRADRAARRSLRAGPVHRPDRRREALAAVVRAHALRRADRRAHDRHGTPVTVEVVFEQSGAAPRRRCPRCPRLSSCPPTSRPVARPGSVRRRGRDEGLAAALPTCRRRGRRSRRSRSVPKGCWSPAERGSGRAL